MFEDNLFLQKRFVFAAGGPEQSAAETTPKTGEAVVESKKAEPTQQEIADKAKRELDTAKKTLVELQATLKTEITKGSILNDAALQSTILQATEQLNTEMQNALKDNQVDEKEMENLKKFVDTKVQEIVGTVPETPKEKMESSATQTTETPTGNLDSFFAALKSPQSSESVKSFSTALGQENLAWLEQNRSAIDETQLSKELSALSQATTTPEQATLLGEKFKAQIVTARRVLAEGQKTSSISALKQRIDSSEQEASKPKTLNDYIKEKGVIGGLIEYLSITLGLKKQPKKEKEKMSEDNGKGVTKVREAYASLTKGNEGKLPTNFSEVFATVGKEMDPKSNPVADSLITPEHLALLEGSGDNKISGEFLKGKMDGFLKIMAEIQKRVDSKELEFKDGKLEVSKVMQEFKDALKGKDATTLKFEKAVSILLKTQAGEKPPISLVEGFNYMLGAIKVDTGEYTVSEVKSVAITDTKNNPNYLVATFKKADTTYTLTFPDQNGEATIQAGGKEAKLKNFSELSKALTEVETQITKEKEEKVQKQKEADEKKEKETKAINALFKDAPTDSNPPSKITDKPELLKTLLVAQDAIKRGRGPDFGNAIDWYIRKNGNDLYLSRFPDDGSYHSAYKISMANDTVVAEDITDKMNQGTVNALGGIPEPFIFGSINLSYNMNPQSPVKAMRWDEIKADIKNNRTYKEQPGEHSYALWKSGANNYQTDDLEGYIIVHKDGTATVYDYDTGMRGSDDKIGMGDIFGNMVLPKYEEK